MKVMDSRGSLFIYVVEDNKIYNRLIIEYLNKRGYLNTRSFLTGRECLHEIAKGENPDIIIQDYFLDDLDGLKVLQRVKKISPGTDFIFLTANESMEVAINTIKFGAFDYIIKDDVALDKVVHKIENISKIIELKRRNRQIRKVMWLFLAVVFVIVVFAVFFFIFMDR